MQAGFGCARNAKALSASLWKPEKSFGGKHTNEQTENQGVKPEMAEPEKADFSPKNAVEKADLSAKSFTTKPKNGKRRKNKSLEQYEDSTAKSRLFSIEQKLGLTGLFDGKVYHLSFDCPKPLAELFKEATKANGTSVCKELQNYALTYVVNYGLQKSAFGNTLSRVLKPKLSVQNLNVTQYVQSRPRRYARVDPNRKEATVSVSPERDTFSSDCRESEREVGRSVTNWSALSDEELRQRIEKAQLYGDSVSNVMCTCELKRRERLKGRQK